MEEKSSHRHGVIGFSAFTERAWEVLIRNFSSQCKMKLFPGLFQWVVDQTQCEGLKMLCSISSTIADLMESLE